MSYTCLSDGGACNNVDGDKSKYGFGFDHLPLTFHVILFLLERCNMAKNP